MPRHLPIPVRPEKDELLSSWLVRMAMANGCDPLNLAGAIWGKWRPWIIDIDRGIPDEKASALAASTGVSQMEIKSMALYETAREVLGYDPPNKSKWPWVMAIGSRNRMRARGPSCCPLCLAEDGVAYFRRHWRYAWHTACATHAVLLRDSCPHCGAVIQYHLLEAEHLVLTRCYECGGDITATAVGVVEPELLAFQQAIDGLLAGGSIEINEVGCRGAEAFQVLMHYVCFVRSGVIGRRDSPLKFLVGLGANFDDGASARMKKVELEGMPLQDRLAIFREVAKVVKMPCSEVVQRLKDAGVTRRAFMLESEKLPAHLEAVAHELTLNPPRTRKPTQKKRKGKAKEARLPTVQEMAFLLRYLRWKYGLSQ